MWAVMTGRLVERQADEKHENKQEDKETDKAWRHWKWETQEITTVCEEHGSQTCGTVLWHPDMKSSKSIGQTSQVLQGMQVQPHPSERPIHVAHSTHTTFCVKPSDGLLRQEMQSVIAVHKQTLKYIVGISSVIWPWSQIFQGDRLSATNERSRC